MNINSGFPSYIPQFPAVPALPDSLLAKRVGLVPLPNKWKNHSPAELIHGKPKEISPISKIIADCDESFFLSCLNKIGKEGLLATIQRGHYKGEKPVHLMLKSLHLTFIQEAVHFFGKEILWEPISTSALDLKHVFPDLFQKNLRAHTLPFIHYFFCQGKMPLNVCEYLLELLPVDEFNVQLSEGPFAGLTPVHFAFLFGNVSTIAWIMPHSIWNVVNMPAGPGNYTNLRPAYILLHSRYPEGFIKRLAALELSKLFEEKPIQEGPHQGYRFIHEAASVCNDRCLFEVIQEFGVECLHEPVQSGPNEGKTALTIIEKEGDADMRRFLRFYSAIPEKLRNFLLKRYEERNIEEVKSVDTMRLAERYINLASVAIKRGDKAAFKGAIRRIELDHPTRYTQVMYHFLYKLPEIQVLGEFGDWVKKYITPKMYRDFYLSDRFFSHPLLMGQNLDQFVDECGRLGLTLPLREGIFRGMHSLHYAALFYPFEQFSSFCERLDELQDCLSPIAFGECAGLTIVHLAALGKDSRNIEYLIQKLGSDCMHEPATVGLYKGKSPAQLASEFNLPIDQTPPSVPVPVSDPAPMPSPIPNPVSTNVIQWLTQKLSVLKKNPLPLIDKFKETGLADYSAYGTEFLTPSGFSKAFPHFNNGRFYHSNTAEEFPAGALDDAAGAFFQVHVSLIQQQVGKQFLPHKSYMAPFLVYTQEAHEVRAHILGGWIAYSLIYGFSPQKGAEAIQIVKDILGESPYRFEEGQIVMDLEGFEKLTKHMAKPGLNLIMMPKMPDPEPQEEVPRQITHVRHPRPPVAPAAPGTDEPISMKRGTPAAEMNPPKRIRLTQSASVPGGVDRRTALSDRAKTTYNAEEERINPLAKRQKQGKLEEVPMGKTVEMPEIAIDSSDPAFFLKNMLKGALEGTLNNLKSAKARRSLIQQEPLPMPIAEKLVAAEPIERVRHLTDLKGYQMEALCKILSLSSQGVMPLLSLEMGLDKTYVFREWILQQIIKNQGGRHLIVVPASVKEQTRQVFQDCLRHIVQTLRNKKNVNEFSPEELSVFFKFPPVIVPTKNEMQAALQNEHAILIVNYEILHALLNHNGHDQLTSIVVDEAQRVHNDQSKTQNTLAALTKVQKLPDQFRQLMVTATPFENDLTELWTLLSSSNPGLVPQESQKALTVGLQKIKENLIDSIKGKSIDTELLVNIYAHYHAFHQILKQLVIYKKTTDLQVIRDWHGKVPTRQDENPEVELAPEVFEALSLATQELIQDKQQLIFNAKSNAALIHTSLIGQSIAEDSPAVQQLCQDAETGDVDEMIARSSFLKLLFRGDNPILERCYRDNLKALVFVDHYATGKLIQIGAKRIYGKPVEFLNGQCSSIKKNSLTDWFENTKEPRILILTPKAGGVGLNLPSAKIVVDLSQDYNIAQHYQAVARAIRANNEGEVKVIRPLFKGSFYQAHVSAHQAKKAQWMEFYFGKVSFENFLEAVLRDTVIDCLNRRKNLSETNADEIAMDHALKAAVATITSDQIEEAVSLVAHPLPAAPRRAPMTLHPRDYFQIALPYGTSREDAIRLAKAFLNPEGNELIKAFMQTWNAAKQNNISAEAIRRANPQMLENLASSSLRRALRIIDDRKKQVENEPLAGKDFHYQRDEQSAVFLSADESQMDHGVYLYKKPLSDGSFHYEPLIAINH